MANTAGKRLLSGMSVAAKKGASLAGEREPALRLRYGLLAAPAAPQRSVFAFLVESSLAPSFCVRVDAFGGAERRLNVDVELGASPG
jgi:hypothetical protein